jgi:hypothetical protein
MYDFIFEILQTWHVVLVGFSNCSSWSPIRFDSASLYARKNTDLEKQKKSDVAIQTRRKVDTTIFWDVTSSKHSTFCLLSQLNL